MILDCDVLQADGGTRTVAITGAYVALHRALAKLVESAALPKLPLREPVAAVSCGIVGGTAVLDLDYAEEAARRPTPISCSPARAASSRSRLPPRMSPSLLSSSRRCGHWPAAGSPRWWPSSGRRWVHPWAAAARRHPQSRQAARVRLPVGAPRRLGSSFSLAIAARPWRPKLAGSSSPMGSGPCAITASAPPCSIATTLGGLSGDSSAATRTARPRA